MTYGLRNEKEYQKREVTDTLLKLREGAIRTILPLIDGMVSAARLVKKTKWDDRHMSCSCGSHSHSRLAFWGCVHDARLPIAPWPVPLHQVK